MQDLIVKEYLGNTIQFKMVEGHVYANATSMCKVFGKQPSDWLKIKSTQEYIDELQGIGTSSEGVKLVKIINDGFNNGTWIHEKLILDLARWLNVKFRVWCDEQITTLLRDGKVDLNGNEQYSLEEKLILNIVHSETNEETALAMKTYREKIVKPLMLENKQQKEYIDHVVINKKYYISPTQIANKFGKSAKALNKILDDIGIIYKRCKKWYLTSDYYGIADYRYYQKPNGEWEKGDSLYYSNEGEKIIFEILVAHGHEPVKVA